MALIGATPVFVDVDEATFNMDANSLKRGIATAQKLGLKPKAVIPVDLFGQPADHDAIAAVAEAEDLFVLDDAAQAFGAHLQEPQARHLRRSRPRPASFRPSRSAAIGDGGAIFTDDDELAETLRSLRVHGQGSDKYDNVRLGLTGRLDTMQAAVLIEKLKIFRGRDRRAQRRSPSAMRAASAMSSTVPRVADGCTSVWAQYTIRLPHGIAATRFAAALKAQGIPTAIYYPKPVHQQTAYRGFPVADGGLPVSERLAEEVISLPMHAYLDEPTQDRIIEAVRGALSNLISPFSRSARAHDCRSGAMLGRIFTVGGFTLLSRLTGFARDIMLAAILGAGPVADAFFVALRLPNHFRAIFAEGAFNAAFVPAYAACPRQGGEDVGAAVRRPHLHAAVCARRSCCWSWRSLFMPQVIELLAPGFADDPEQRRARDRAHAHHLSLSAADHAGDALWRHPQRHAPLCQRRRGADLAQSLDDGDAGAGRVLSRPRATRRPGAC